MILRVGVLFFLILAAARGQQAAPPPKSPLFDAKKQAIDELQKIGLDMEKKGYKGEAGDAGCIIRKLSEWDKPMRSTGGSAPFPGEAEYEENVLVPWTALGTKLAGAFADAAKACEEKAKEEEKKTTDATTKIEKAKADFARQAALRDKDEADLISGWFKTWPDVALAIRQLNRRRKFGHMGPVTCTWAGTIGGYFHGRYLMLNANDPSTAGLGAHNENPKLPGSTVEGSDAAGGILAGGSPEGAIDGWIGSGFHRDPVFNRSCGRVALGGGYGGWSCKNAGGISAKIQSNVFTFPGDGDTDIPTGFGGELPNPLPNGMTSSGTFFVIEFSGTAPQKPTYRVLNESGKEVELIVLTKYNPITFVARKPLEPNKKYSVEVVGVNDFKYKFSFTTGGGYGMRQKPPDQPPPKPPDKPAGGDKPPDE